MEQFSLWWTNRGPTYNNLATCLLAQIKHILNKRSAAQNIPE